MPEHTPTSHSSVMDVMALRSVTELPVIVAIDSQGRNVYETGRAAYEQD